MSSLAYVDMGNSYSTILQQQEERLALTYDGKNITSLQGYGNGQTATIGVSFFTNRS